LTLKPELNPAPGKRTAWTDKEDKILIEGVQKGLTWVQIAVDLPPRTAKQCRNRYVNQLNPAGIQREWSAEEDAIIIAMYRQIGSKWSLIAKNLEGRTDNAVKNRFNGWIRKSGLVDQSHEKQILPSTET